ncbi:hypothetical protein L210DRAFT_2523797 [Boletus edulis BED1]|uniref:Uncharacterized protein n=1 Tax=Boletus edulis BED1 TaxID=1328754 RepID=A0AAD4GBY3_BOLED|nr:hypothetical protein L210DRAFT_2523797 [Boletus edulis BED1]
MLTLIPLSLPLSTGTHICSRWLSVNQAHGFRGRVCRICSHFGGRLCFIYVLQDVVTRTGIHSFRVFFADWLYSIEYRQPLKVRRTDQSGWNNCRAARCTTPHGPLYSFLLFKLTSEYGAQRHIPMQCTRLEDSLIRTMRGNTNSRERLEYKIRPSCAIIVYFRNSPHCE